MSPSPDAPSLKDKKTVTFDLSDPEDSDPSHELGGSISTANTSSCRWSAFSKTRKSSRFSPEQVKEIGDHWKTSPPGTRVMLSLSILPSRASSSGLSLVRWDHRELSSEIPLASADDQKSAQEKRSIVRFRLGGEDPAMGARASTLDIPSETSSKSVADTEPDIVKLDSLKKLRNGQGKPSLVVAPFGEDAVHIKQAVKAMKKKLLKPNGEGTTPGIHAQYFLGHTSDRMLEELEKCDEYVATVEEQLLKLSDVAGDKGISSRDSPISQDAPTADPEELKAEIKRARAEQERMKSLIEALNETFREYV